jgi:hypothetical protein
MEARRMRIDAEGEQDKERRIEVGDACTRGLLKQLL